MTLQQAEAKWVRKTENAGQKWKAGVRQARTSGDDPCTGLVESGLITAGDKAACETNVGHPWDQGVEATSAQQFQASVQGKGDKWREGFLRGVTGK